MSGDLHVPDLGHLGAPGEEVGEEGLRGVRVRGLDPPEQAVATAQAGGRGGAPAERAVEAAPGREGGGALVGTVAVVEEEVGHGDIFGGEGVGNIGDGPSTGGPGAR